MEQVKISDVTKLLKAFGFTKLDGEAAICSLEKLPNKCYYKYRGALYVDGQNVGFCIRSKKDAKIFGAYAIGATDSTGASSDAWTSIPQFFFPRLFGFIKGEISEAEIIAEICA